MILTANGGLDGGDPLIWALTPKCIHFCGLVTDQVILQLRVSNLWQILPFGNSSAIRLDF